MDKELEAIARTLVWWKSPEAVERSYLVRRVMDIGTPDMLRIVRDVCGEPAMREALATAEPGSFSPQSWNYWHVVFGIRPTPSLPQRIVPDSSHVSAEIRRAAASAARPVASAR